MLYYTGSEEDSHSNSETFDIYYDCTDEMLDESTDCKCKDCSYITELILIDRLKLKAVPDENLNNRFCTICLSISITQFHRFSCSHSFHFECLLEWIKTKNTDCPICRKNII